MGIRLPRSSFRPATSLAFIVDMTASAYVFPFDLEGGVVDCKLMAQMLGGLVQKGVIAALGHDQVGGENVFRGAGRPDMEIVDALHPRQPGEIVEYRLRLDMFWHPGHGEVERILEQPPAGNEDNEGDGYGY